MSTTWVGGDKKVASPCCVYNMGVGEIKKVANPCTVSHNEGCGLDSTASTVALTSTKSVFAQGHTMV